MTPLAWRSSIEVEALEGNENLDYGHKAFVNGAVWAIDAVEAEDMFRKSLAEERFHVVAFETARLNEPGTRAGKVLKSIVKAARKTGKPQFGEFFTWEKQG